MKKTKFSGRELALLRAVDFSIGSSGTALIERTQFQADEMLDLLNALVDAGFLETDPPVARVEMFALPETHFEINPSYAHDLKTALLRR